VHEANQKLKTWIEDARGMGLRPWRGSGSSLPLTGRGS